MTWASTMALLVMAFMLDYGAIGADRFRDKVAWFLATPALYTALDGSSFQRATTGKLREIIAAGLEANNLAAVGASNVIKAIVFGIVVWTIGCLVPDGWAKKMGRFAKLEFGKQGPTDLRRINGALWVSAISLATLAPMADGLTGALLGFFLDTLSTFTAELPDTIMGVK